MRIARIVLRALGAVLAAVVVALGLWALVPAGTAAIDGPDAIASVERVTLGGFPQTILVRGRDRHLPVLLYVHGGPGFGQLPLAPLYSGQLERHFVVVHWDQRGAGASCSGVDFATVTRERIVADTVELAEQLNQRFGGPIILLGHSWGSVVGALALQARPELFRAYVGVGQLVNGRRNEELSYQFVHEQAEREGNQQALAELATVHPPYATIDALVAQRRWLGVYRGSLYDTERAKGVLPAALLGREYTLATKARFFSCFRRSLERLWSSLDGFDAIAQIPRLERPVYLFTGRHDWNTPYPLIEEWAAKLAAPHVEIVWFDGAGHVPPIEAPEEFQRDLIEKLAAPGATR